MPRGKLSVKRLRYFLRAANPRCSALRRLDFLSVGAGAILFLTEGLMAALEAFTCEEPWQDSEDPFEMVPARMHMGPTRYPSDA
jgi:hypothetical protein